jgi:hypothetical protein
LGRSNMCELDHTILTPPLNALKDVSWCQKMQGKTPFSNKSKQIATSVSSPSDVGFKLFAHIFLKTRHKHIIDILQHVDISPCMHKSKMSRIITWKS